jgi:hypothetical protein
VKHAPFMDVGNAVGQFFKDFPQPRFFQHPTHVRVVLQEVRKVNTGTQFSLDEQGAFLFPRIDQHDNVEMTAISTEVMQNVHFFQPPQSIPGAQIYLLHSLDGIQRPVLLVFDLVHLTELSLPQGAVDTEPRFKVAYLWNCKSVAALLVCIDAALPHSCAESEPDVPIVDAALVVGVSSTLIAFSPTLIALSP